jgi:FtsH-binding integral membrane protein
MGRSSIYNRLFGKGLFGKGLLKGGAKMNLFSLMNEKKEFLILVFANLIAQLGITYYVMEKTNDPNISIWPLFCAQLIIIFVITLVPMPEYLKFFVFCGFSYIFGIMLSGLKNKYSPEMMNLAISGAMTVFGVMMAAGIALIAGGINLGYKFGAMLFWALLALIVARLVFVLGTKMDQAHKILSFFGIILFAVYVLYDTNIILQRNYSGDFITASMDYYLDILNLFTSFLGSSDN